MISAIEVIHRSYGGFPTAKRTVRECLERQYDLRVLYGLSLFALWVLVSERHRVIQYFYRRSQLVSETNLQVKLLLRVCVVVIAVGVQTRVCLLE